MSHRTQALAELRQTELGSAADAIAEYFRRVDRGEEIDAARFIDEHPELKVELGEFFNAARAIERMAGPTGEQPSTYGNEGLRIMVMGSADARK